jgi:hypothetical protein
MLPSYALPSYALPSYALPSYALPSRALPSRALLLINEYSKPMTRPNWRKSKPLTTTYQLYNNTLIRDGLLMAYLLMNIVDTDWYYLYMCNKYT